MTRQEKKTEPRIHVFSNEKYEAVFNVRGFNGPLSKISCTSCHAATESGQLIHIAACGGTVHDSPLIRLFATRFCAANQTSTDF